jgi:ectoine hydroxylase-related dioxygenase (phytanoyl-CoA dioxygenase family)
MQVQEQRDGVQGGVLKARYDEDGYVMLPALLNEEDLAPARAAMMQKVDMIARELLAAGLIADTLEDRPFETRLAELFASLTDADFLRHGRSWRDRLPGYYELMANPKILDVVEALIGPEIFANPVYNVRPKVPRVAAGAVPWHQDKSYWPDANANPVITVWIPLVDATLENGCLHILPRTHKRQLLSYHRETYSGTGYTETDDQHLGNKDRVVALPLEAGGAIVFNDRCLHMSTPNNSAHVRWSVDLRYQPTDQDPMPQHGVGFLARSRRYPERVATLEDWEEGRPEHSTAVPGPAVQA